jgi:hypothetical protein
MPVRKRARLEHGGVARGVSLAIRRAPHFSTKADSGADKDCVFCPTCATRIYNAFSSMPATFNVKPGTLVGSCLPGDRHSAALR